jgi:uncharacterized membrane protein YesL
MSGEEHRTRVVAEATTGWLHQSCLWIYRLALVNLLWIAFTLAGGVVAGFFPATVAMFAVIRGWLMGAEEGNTRQVFWTVFRAELLRANGVGYLMALIGYVLRVDLAFFMGRSGLLEQAFLVGSLGLALVYCLTLVYLFPVYVHVDAPWHKRITTAAMLAVAHPFRAVLVLMGAVSLYVVLSRVPGLAVFFGGSVLCAFALWQTLRALSRHAA